MNKALGPLGWLVAGDGMCRARSQEDIVPG
jgi:hypothetical protein